MEARAEPVPFFQEVALKYVVWVSWSDRTQNHYCFRRGWGRRGGGGGMGYEGMGGREKEGEWVLDSCVEMGPTYPMGGRGMGE